MPSTPFGTGFAFRQLFEKPHGGLGFGLAPSLAQVFERLDRIGLIGVILEPLSNGFRVVLETWRLRFAKPPPSFCRRSNFFRPLAADPKPLL